MGRDCKGNMMVLLLACIFGLALVSWLIVFILSETDDNLSLEKSEYNCEKGKCFVEYVVRNNTSSSISYIAEIRVYTDHENTEKLSRLIQFPFTLANEYQSSSYLFQYDEMPSNISVTLIER